ncbi:MAG: FtsX-like permease family protein, partial [Gammaproteobacteria bacterium]|nr:FtsX-like permease family protein [Gammaproteobacteria bacterium]
AKKSAIIAVGALLLAALIIGLSTDLVSAFFGLFVLIMGAALLTPLVVLMTGALLRPFTRGRPYAALIVEGAVASLSRTGVAVAALTVAVAAVIGVAVMITSFRGSVVDWLEGSLAADFYISAPERVLTDSLADSLGALPEVDYVSRSRWVDLATDQGPVELWALELPAGQAPAVDIRQGDPAAALQAFAETRAVLVSEAFASRQNLAPGDSIQLPVGAEQQRFDVAGVHRDYASPGGVVLMRRALYQSLYGDDALSGVGVHLQPQTDRAMALTTLEQRVGGTPGARVVDNAAIFDQSLAIFDRTFAITGVLRWLAGLVAFVGVLGALMALHLDRTREFAVLRAIGLSRSGLGWVIGGQSGLLGLVAGLCAIPLGVALAWLLVFVINQRAFGWTMGFDLHAMPLLEGVMLAVLAALIAAVQPALRAARLAPALLLAAAVGGAQAQNMADVMGPDIDTDRFARVTGPQPLVFPDDHGAHPDYRTEWWYFVGNLADDQGQAFGFQLTLFRSALDPERQARSSNWATRQAWMGHFAITDITGGDHRAVERYQRGALGLAGAQVRPVRIWMDDWQALSLTDATLFPLQLSAQDEQTEIGLDLNLEALKPHVLQGNAGYSQKGEDPGNASCYYSFTRLGAEGQVTFAGQTYTVDGTAWLDREWSTSALDSNQEGWDWFSLQLQDGRDVMVYRLRRTDGSTAPQSAGIVVEPDGQSSVLSAQDFTLTPIRHWQSPKTDSRYPVEWSLSIPEHNLELSVEARLDAQEMPTTIRYWEGAVGVQGSTAGVGYMELTGY